MNKAIKTNPLSYLCKPFNKSKLQAALLLGEYKVQEFNNIIQPVINSNYFNIGLGYYYDFIHKRLFYNEL